ncbi:hypothetical protein B0I35DRAFT_451529 [Stachybotrys elegans]|uniref:Bicarbonate transporter-like transmembrane domain-containing protein n=1 Tax=Stachybotrys elegans TaxID=80388 RepID=A0A8K0WPJ4_9HYPO|nr:hypothetical protein B0I35DRAFT_451529 [Stachybotrys elegans]
MSPSITAPGRRQDAAYFGPGGRFRPFRLLSEDVSSIKKRYVSDWALFNQQVMASAVYIFFTNILPGMTFANDLFIQTGKSWGTIEIIFSTGFCGLVFSIFSAQPLTILGVTGPFAVLAENIYDLCEGSFNVRFLPIMAWALIHAGWMHYLLAIFNAHDWTMQYVTNFSADIFSLLNSVIYFHKAALELQRTHSEVSLAAFLYSIIGAVGTCLFAILLSTANSWKPLFHRYVRLGLTEYAAAISIVLWIGIPHMGELADLDHLTLQVQTTLRPTDPERRSFFVKFWQVPIEWVFLSIIPGAIITVLFYFDHEISSIICTNKRYGIRKPGGFAWDIVLLGTTTIICGILGIPAANGLLPQAPLHSESLMYYELEPSPVTSDDEVREPPIHVARTYEQRYSAFIQAAMILAFISPPLQRVLGLTQTSVLAGLFMFMGYQSLSVNPILDRIVQLLSPPSDLPALPSGVTWLGIHTFTIAQIVLTGIVFGITLTVAAPAFPLIIIALVPVRLTLMNRIWSRETLRLVDGWACREGKPEDDTVQAEDVSTDEEKVLTPSYAGINLEFARLLLHQGCSVMLADLQLRPAAEALVKEYAPRSKSDSGNRPIALYHQTNVVSWPDLHSLWSAALEAFPTVDVVCPGAGIFEPAWSSFWEPPRTATNPDSASRDPADADLGHYAVLDINLTAPIRLSQMAIGHWTQRGEKGCLVHIGSVAGLVASFVTPLYTASKHGLHGFVRSLGGLRDELGIRVSAVAPGIVRTPMWDEDPTKAETITEDAVWVRPEDVAQAMLRLVVDEALGDGTVLEVLPGGTRVVPPFDAPPPSMVGVAWMGYMKAQQDIVNGLKKASHTN